MVYLELGMVIYGRSVGEQVCVLGSAALKEEDLQVFIANRTRWHKSGGPGAVGTQEVRSHHNFVVSEE